MEPPPKPASPATTSLFQVFLRLRPHGSSSAPPSVPPTPSKSLYPTLPQVPERFLAVEPVEQSAESHETGQATGERPSEATPTHITIHPPSRGDARKRAVEKFAFTRVFEEDKGQLDLYNGVGVAGIIEGVVKDGRDGLLATLGVTGSGKTHTILGSRSQRGLTQLSLELLFRSLDSKTINPGHSPMLIPSLITADSSEAHIYGAASFLDGIYGDNYSSRAGTPMTDITHTTSPMKKHALQRPSAAPTHPDISGSTVASSRGMDFAVVVSMYEVYNDRIFDLLSYNRGAKDTRRRPLLFKSTEGSPDRKVVAGLRKIVCGSYEEAIMVLETGLMERRVAGTGSNSVSSRSHGFFCVEVKKRARGGMASRWTSSTMTIVDLAGSERARNAKTAGATLAEAGKINESLMYLGQCLQMQFDSCDSSKPAIVPFRQCKLTELLFSNSFPSHTSTTHHPQPQRAVMIVTADPYGDFNATSQILRYSALAREVTVPRIPSVTTLVFQGSLPPSSGKNSGRTTPESPVQELRELEAEVARLTDQVDILTLQVAEERVRRREAESSWRRAEEKMELLEQTVREEVVADMELRAAQDRRRWLDALGEAADASDAHFDRKLELLENERAEPQLVHVFEDTTATPGRRVPLTVERNAELEEENRELRARLRRMENELHGRSPTKGSATRGSGKSPNRAFPDGSPTRYSPGPSPTRGSNTTPMRSSALRHVLSHEGPPKMNLGLGTSRLGLCDSSDVFSMSRASSPLVSCPSTPRSPSPLVRANTPDSFAEETRMPPSAGTTLIAHQPERGIREDTFPPLPDEDTSLFATALSEVDAEGNDYFGPQAVVAIAEVPTKDGSEAGETSIHLDEAEDDKENAPSKKTLAATQALAAFALRSYSTGTNNTTEDEDVERELSALEKEAACTAKIAATSASAKPTTALSDDSVVLLEAHEAAQPPAPARATRSSTRVLRSSVASPVKSAPAAEVNVATASPKKKGGKQSTAAAKESKSSPAKKKSAAAAASPAMSPKKLRALTPHRGLSERAVRDGSLRVSASDGGSDLGYEASGIGSARSSFSLAAWNDGAADNSFDDSNGDGSGNWVVYE